MENLSTKRIDMSTAAIYSLPSYLLQVKLTPKTWKTKDKNYFRIQSTNSGCPDKAGT